MRSTRRTSELGVVSAHAFDLQGHRGARGLAPENTLPAFRKALDLGRHVERRRRLIGDEDPGAAGEGYGDHGSLPKAAGELEGVFVDSPLRLRDAD